MDDWESEGFDPALPALSTAKPKGLWDDEDIEDVKASWEDADVPSVEKGRLCSLMDAVASSMLFLMNKFISRLTRKNLWRIESEGFDPALPALSTAKPKGLWDDEDIEDVKASWEDADVPSVEKASKPEPPVVKAASKVDARGKKGKPAAPVADEKLADPVAEKLRQQRLVEEADYKSTTELFAPRSDDKSLANFIPKSESDFLEYAELIAHKLQPYEKSFHYISLLKTVMRLSTVSLKAADVKEIASSITTIANEKLKAEKEANAKKKTAKKKQLHVDKGDDSIVDTYEALDDYDFM